MPKLVPATTFGRGLRPRLSLTNRIYRTALQADPRISYEAYIPDAHYPPDDNTQKLPLLVAIHGTGRDTEKYLNIWKDFADTNKCAVSTPLFLALLQGPLDFDGYHFLGRAPPWSGEPAETWLNASVEVETMAETSGDPATDLRYDLLLLKMLDEVSIRWPAIDTSKVFLTGFSGGGQFGHRFFYLHPERLAALSVGAPGSITAFNYEQNWPTGLKNIEDIFNQTVDVSELKKIPILGSVGSNDTGPGTPRLRSNVPGSNFGTEEETNETRVDGLVRLMKGWQEAGLDASYTVVEGPGHEMIEVNPVVAVFMEKHIRKYWKDQEG
ncbi:hypothetical protein PMZ80_001450 [Knufia obscura]|uniref:Uncharacterized protein n=2 Tax=Knufia TaxID=430999 RepID=A0AAN8EHL2_9EURO|nr:hypothetical protein PMZ80_001450 [Knufia obscura]KAK5955728.1 hypothetical protein OHC33_003369 [Knufia fluminis]